ncbi:hypothetical protein Sjap_002412 [Stephania japonica]|uniref:Uncharacterized protein n=1 Tax=Stephania japonica TaxID=461633 RepID=A0AAP0KLT6_9MAGN
MTKSPVKATLRPCLSLGPLGLQKAKEDKFPIRSSSRLGAIGLSGRKVPPSNTPSTALYIEDDGDDFNDIDEQDNTRVKMDGLDLTNYREAVVNLQASFMNRK